MDPAHHPAAGRGTISLDELAAMTVIYGPRRTEPVTYDVWTTMLRPVQPRLDLTDSPFRHSLPMTLAFAATGDRPAAVLPAPSIASGTGLDRPTPIPEQIHRIVTRPGIG
jgi:hypothetical protein